MEKLKYVHVFRDRHGRLRHYFRRHGKRIALPGVPGTQIYRQAYEACEAGLRLPTLPQIVSEEKIIAHAMPWDGKCCGIYFLVREERIIYVGASRNVYIRMPRHKGRGFDRWYWIPCEEEHLEVVERFYITTMLPEQNRDHEAVRLRNQRQSASVNINGK